MCNDGMAKTMIPGGEMKRRQQQRYDLTSGFRPGPSPVEPGERTQVKDPLVFNLTLDPRAAFRQAM